MPSAATAAPTNGKTVTYQVGSVWITGPWTDLLIGCGGWSIPLLIASYTLVDRDVPRWSALFYGLALVCNYPHYMLTG